MNEREFDIAASVQKVCEEVVLQMVRYIHQETGLTEPVHGRAAWRSTAWPTAA